MERKKVLVAVTGGIAVYKSVTLVSRLAQKGYDVKVVMTEGAKQFVQPLAFQVMSRNDVYFDTFDEKDSSVIAHIDLADWADLIVVAPATANMIGKLANGIADDMVSTTLLATKAPIWIAPAMNVDMYHHPAVQRNMDQLVADGYTFVEPGEGFLACGYVGKGRMEEPEVIAEKVTQHFEEDKEKLLEGKHVLVTAGPTLERIDPVRYISNFSSGKMGFAMARAAKRLGADVTLVAGVTSLPTPEGVERVDVESAEEMFQAVIRRYDVVDIVVKSAAVADYRPKHVSDQKTKKQAGPAVIELERTTDILKTLGEQKTDQLLVGFAAETENVLAYGEKKLQEKNLDYIIINDVTNPDGGFGNDTNVVTLMRKDGNRKPYPAMDKEALAYDILRTIAQKEVDA